MKVDTGFDPTESKVIITVQTPLLERYLRTFRKIFENSTRIGMPEGIKIERHADRLDTAYILFPVDKKDIASTGKQSAVVGINMECMKSISDELNHFVVSALKSKLKSVEFIPLEGYPVENLMDEVKNAVEGKRGFCIIKNYEEYLKTQTPTKDSYIFNQYMVEYGTDEYTDIAIELYNGEMEDIREKYTSKLKLQNWI